ncbi:hypothetical protein CEXT_25141 [Caerostris extrusa]|uniref:Uncharacterized protein n=1 Tax=Caerostris extrusa TaxID=172846 RepID=A0AAV4R2T9_CAEEX|nr:hypothetical protein CEXT_25141 [Caerostris extrusa]
MHSSKPFLRLPLSMVESVNRSFIFINIFYRSTASSYNGCQMFFCPQASPFRLFARAGLVIVKNPTVFSRMMRGGMAHFIPPRVTFFHSSSKTINWPLPMHSNGLM